MNPDENGVHGTFSNGSEELGHRVLIHRALEFAFDSQFITSADGLIQKANDSAVTLLRCRKEFLIEKPLGLFVVPGSRRRFYETLTRLRQGTPSDQFDTQMLRRGDEPRDVVARVLLLDQTGYTNGTPYFRWILRDVTEWNTAESARIELLRKLITVQEDERRRISRELHDSIGQLLTALSLTVKAARDAAPLSPKTDARLAEVQNVADELGKVAHDFTVRLRPTSLDDLGLHAALSQHIARWSKQTGIEIDFEGSSIETRRLPAEVETTIYRLVQEALTNVARHAKAGKLSAIVSRNDESVSVVVEDNGVGFDLDAAAASGRLGLAGMRERVSLIGGTLELESSQGNGTTLFARIPLNKGVT
jgi:signal transduction histidine kinase